MRAPSKLLSVTPWPIAFAPLLSAPPMALACPIVPAACALPTPVMSLPWICAVLSKLPVRLFVPACWTLFRLDAAPWPSCAVPKRRLNVLLLFVLKLF